jgi:PAP2 superfamily
MGGVGSPTSLGALAGFSGDPLLTDALIRARARNLPNTELDAWQPPRSGEFASGRLPDDTPKHLDWWQPDVRSHLALQELHSGLVFDTYPTPQSQEDGPLLVARLRYADVPVSGLDEGAEKVDVEWRPVVKLMRPARNVFEGQVKLVEAHARNDSRRSRAAEILTQVLPQVPYWSSIVPLSPWRNQRTFEFIGIVLHFGMQVCHRFKHALAVPRPNELSLQVQPILQTPGWSAFPSGHATEVYMFARLMRELMGQNADSGLHDALQKQARGIADNRVYAGLHYPIDSVAGQLLGETLAEYVISRCTHPGKDESNPGKGASKAASWTSREFKGDGGDLSSLEFDPLRLPLSSNSPKWLAQSKAQSANRRNPILGHLWSRAVHEWTDVGLGAPLAPQL